MWRRNRKKFYSCIATCVQIISYTLLVATQRKQKRCEPGLTQPFKLVHFQMLLLYFTISRHAHTWIHPLQEIVIALRTVYYTLRKQRLDTVVMATVLMATQQTRIAFTCIRLTNFTQAPYRNFLSVLQCISNHAEYSALVKYSHRSSTLPANSISNYSSTC